MSAEQAANEIANMVESWFPISISKPKRDLLRQELELRMGQPPQGSSIARDYELARHIAGARPEESLSEAVKRMGQGSPTDDDDEYRLMLGVEERARAICDDHEDDLRRALQALDMYRARTGGAKPQGTERADERPETTACANSGSVDPSRAVADQPAGRPELPESKSAPARVHGHSLSEGLHTDPRSANASPAGPWRVGRKLGRTLYCDNELVGLIDSPRIAASIVAGLNADVERMNEKVDVANATFTESIPPLDLNELAEDFLSGLYQRPGKAHGSLIDLLADVEAKAMLRERERHMADALNTTPPADPEG